MKVLTLYDKSGPKYHRCLLPLFLMDGIELVVNHTLEEEQLNVDVVYINRVIPRTTLNEICELRSKYGFKLIVDFDDHWKLDYDHYLYDTYQAFRATELMEAYIEEADAVTVTHERLSDAVGPKAYILPNAIPKFGQFDIKRTESPFVRLFWAGGITHRQDINILRGPIKRFYFDNAMMVMGGFVEGSPEYREMANSYTNGGRIRHNLIKSLPVDSYYHSYSECDIALIPLKDTTFNSFKSNLKILEAANLGCPVIVSRVHPYLDFPEDLVNYVNSQSDWYDHVKMLLRNPDYAKEQGLKLQAYCRDVYNFERINNKRKDLFYAITGKQRETKEAPTEDHAVANR